MVVYLIKQNNEGRYKIGHTKNISNRIKSLQTANAESLIICDVFQSDNANKIEKNLHRYFNHKKLIDEWFELDLEDEIRFKQLCEKFEKTLNLLEVD